MREAGKQKGREERRKGVGSADGELCGLSRAVAGRALGCGDGGDGGQKRLAGE